MGGEAGTKAVNNILFFFADKDARLPSAYGPFLPGGK
jgi:hypothetical protein